jgi:hypothetical protein
MKDSLPYFSHDNDSRRHPKMKALIAEYGYEGYGRFWALNERIAESSGAYVDISKKVNRLDLANELGLDGNGLEGFLKFLSDPEINLINIQNGKITTDRVTELFSKTMENREHERDKKQQRKQKKGNEEIPEGNDDFPDSFPGENENFPKEKDTDKTRQDKIRQDNNKQDKTKQNSCGSDEPPDKKPVPKQKPVKQKKLPLREREPVNDMERVEKAYLQNWDLLYSQGRVQTPEPIMSSETWKQTRKLLKDLFMKLKPEQIIQAVNNGLKDDWIMNGGYYLSTILTASQLNKLINTTQAETACSLPDENEITVWNEARKFWNEQGLKPECRDVFPKESDAPEIRQIFKNYSLDEIKNAIDNFAWHKSEAGNEYRPPPDYLSFAGFLKRGVEKYFDDAAIEQEFKREKR